MIQTSGLKRDTIDKFYTKTNIVELCIEYIKQNIDFDFQNDIIVEPSAGNGAWIKYIKELCNNYKFYDLYPEHDEIQKQDYLKLDYKQFEQYNKKWVIGNCPYGRQSTLLIKFIKYSCLYCDGFAFIVPKSFKKDSYKKKIPLQFHLQCEIDLPENSFINNQTEFDVPCIFQIWIKQDQKRILPQIQTPKNFKFVKKHQNHDISFRRIGVYAGSIDTNTQEKSIQSHYFIKFNDFNEQIYQKLKNIHFNTADNTVGPKSISKPELIKEFNNL